MTNLHNSVPSQPRPADAHGPGVQPGLLGTFDNRSVDIPAQLARQAAELHELRVEADRLRAERDRLADRQLQVAELLKSDNADKIVHDLRNVLNELQLYKMLVETQGT
jgi:signal transduction histidine kinase